MHNDFLLYYNKMHFIFKFIIVLLILLTLDFIYLNLKIIDYNSVVVKIQKSSIAGFNKPLGLLAYLFMTIAVLYSKNYKESALFGLVIYSIFNLTNYSLFNDWDGKTAIVDTTWGTILFSITGFISMKLNSK
jgi:uncharacterized membrane protein